MAGLTPVEFLQRRRSLKSYAEKENLLRDALAQENIFRGLFATHRDSWSVPEVGDDPFVGLVEVFENIDIFKRLPNFPEDVAPRCFELKDKKISEGQLTIVPTLNEFETNWDCFTESQLRFMDWTNVFAAGGAVAGCMSPLPKEVLSDDWAVSRQKRRKFFHDVGFPGSDVDLFIYGLDAQQAERKLLEIFQAVQASNLYEVICFRSAHAITLVSQYPLRHIQIVLRLYNSPAEVLMGFDVDSCACGFDGRKVYVCPRTAIAFAAQANTVDMSRRSPSYEMRLAKYAERAFEVIVPSLQRDRVDPFLYEKRFDQLQGLSRLLILERLSTPEARFQYRQEQRLKTASRHEKYKIQRELRKGLKDKHQLYRMETTIVGTAAGAEASNYSTVFLPWGPDFTAKRIQRLMRKKDHVLNTVEFLAKGRVAKCTRKYKIHVCASGTMSQVIDNPFPNDPAIPESVPSESLSQCVRGRVSWLVDNPGRQQIGSFHPITEGDWTEGAFLASGAEELLAKCVAGDVAGVSSMLEGCDEQRLTARDFLGRTVLHVAILANQPLVCKALLSHHAAGTDFLQARLADGRQALHLAAMRGHVDILHLLLQKRRELQAAASLEEEEKPEFDPLDIDCADWEVKLSPLQYSVALGHEEAMAALLREGANAKKVAVQKDRNLSLSILELAVILARGRQDLQLAKRVFTALLVAGASSTQVDLEFKTIWHHLAMEPRDASILDAFLAEDPQKARTIDVLDTNGYTPLARAAEVANKEAISVLLKHGALPKIGADDFETRTKQLAKNRAASIRWRRYMLASPIWFVVQDGPLCRGRGVECLRVFLEHDASLALECCRDPHRNGQEQRLLDVVQTLKEHREEQKAQKVKNIAAQEKIVLGLREALQDKTPEGSYAHRLRRLVLEKEEVNLRKTKEEDLSSEDGDETDRDPEEKPTGPLDAAIAILTSNGAERTPDDTENPHGNQGMSRRFRHSTPRESMDPLESFGEEQMNQRWYFQNNSWRTIFKLPEGDQVAAHALFDAVFRGDMAGVEIASTRICISTLDVSGATPLMVAAMRADTPLLHALYDEAVHQYQLSRKKAQQPEGEPEDIAAQLKRINNLNLVDGGGVPKDSGPNPDEMRLRLETLEKGVVAATAGPGSTASPEKILSAVEPYTLLCNRSVVECSEVLPELEDLRQKLKAAFLAAAEAVGSTLLAEQPEDHSAFVKLSPVELAIVRADLPLLKTLLALALGGGAGDKACTEEGDDVEDGGEGGEVAGIEDDDDDSDDNEEINRNAEEGDKPATPVEVRRAIVHVANPFNLCSLTSLHLAVVVDRPDILMAVAGFAQEWALPLGAVEAWHREVHTLTSSEGKSDFRRHSFRTSSSALDKSTLLQVALLFNSRAVARHIISGQADDILLGWLLQAAAAEAPEFSDGGTGRNVATRPKRQRGNTSADGPLYLTHKWLIPHIRSTRTPRTELVRRLVGPDAVDGHGRTALFYAPPWAVPELAKAGANLEHRDASGTTALLAAAGCGDIPRIEALLAAGCSRITTAPPRMWNALHYGVQCGRRCGAARAVAVGEALLAGAGEAETVSLVMSEQAEHTPLMIALRSSFEEDEPAAEVARWLSGRMTSAALARRDKQLCTALHFGAEALSPNVLKVLLEASEHTGSKAGGAPILTPAAENARGLTAAELVAEKAVQVWDALQNSIPMHQRFRTKRGKTQTRNEGGPPMVTKAHRCVEVLKMSESLRDVVSFEEVRIATKASVEQASETAANSRGSSEDMGGRTDPVLNTDQWPFGHSITDLMPNIQQRH